MPTNRIGYDHDVALAICELVAGGKTLRNISKRGGFPSRSTIYAWLVLNPKFYDAYERAKELSAQHFEEEALDMSRELREANDFSGTKVQAYNVAMGQLRWSAARRDKTRYGQQIQGQTTVPIQINTTLNLGQEGQGPATSDSVSIYTVEAAITLGPTPEEYERKTEALTLEGLTSEGTVLDLSPEPDDNAEEVPDVPAPKRAVRLGKRHKSPAMAAATAQRYAKRTE
jgi:hypothetical protein